MPQENQTAPPNQTNIAEQIDAQSPLRISIEFDDYRPYFEGQDISEEEKRDLFDALVRIMLAFVDLGFQLDPTQAACGQRRKIGDASPSGHSDRVKYKGTKQHETKRAEGDLTPSDAKGATHD